MKAPARLLFIILLAFACSAQAQFKMAVVKINDDGTHKNLTSSVSLTVTDIMDETQPVVTLAPGGNGIFEYTGALPTWLSVTIKDSMGITYMRKVFAAKGKGSSFYIGQSAYYEFRWGTMRPYTPVKNLYYIEAAAFPGATSKDYQRLARELDSLGVKELGPKSPVHTLTNTAIRQRVLARLLKRRDIAIVQPLYCDPGKGQGISWFDHGVSVCLDASLNDVAAAGIFKKHGIAKFTKLKTTPNEYAAYTSCVFYYIEFTPAQMVDYSMLKILTALYAHQAVLYIQTNVIDYAIPH